MIFEWLKGLFARSDEAWARQLNRDAPLIVEHAERMFKPPRLAEVTAAFAEHLARAHQMFGHASIDLRRAEDEYRKLHREARRRNAQTDLTAMTLVIIHLRSERIGVAAAPARAVIDQFAARWGPEEAARWEEEQKTLLAEIEKEEGR
jgi:hypothetical protein